MDLWLEEGTVTHSSTLDWRTPWERSLAGYGPWGCKESDTTSVTEHARKHGLLGSLQALSSYL